MFGVVEVDVDVEAVDVGREDVAAAAAAVVVVDNMIGVEIKRRASVSADARMVWLVREGVESRNGGWRDGRFVSVGWLAMVVVALVVVVWQDKEECSGGSKNWLAASTFCARSCCTIRVPAAADYSRPHFTRGSSTTWSAKNTRSQEAVVERLSIVRCASRRQFSEPRTEKASRL